MKKILAIFAVAMFSLCGGKAFAQRCLPGMSAVEIKADMADGFYTGNSRNCGYSLGVFYSVYKGSANTWSFGGEYLQIYKPYGVKGRIPVAQFTGEVGYNLHLLSDYSQTFNLYGGELGRVGFVRRFYAPRRRQLYLWRCAHALCGFLPVRQNRPDRKYQGAFHFRE